MQVFNKEGLVLGFKFKKQNTIRQEEYLEKQAKKFPKALFYAFFVYFVVFAIYMISYVCFTYTYELSEVHGQSMQNTLNPYISSQDDCHDLVYVNTKKSPERFDIIVVKDVGNSGDTIKLIKRAIGMPGDLITIVKDESDKYYHVYYADAEKEEVYRSNEEYVKSYEEWSKIKPSCKINNVTYEDEFHSKFIASGDYVTHVIDNMVFFEVPQDCVFYLGDNRARSSDSRIRGVGKLADVEGVADIILHDAGRTDANVFGIKFRAIFSFIWDRLNEFFAR